MARIVQWYLKANYGITNGLFYHPRNDTDGAQWIKVMIESDNGETSTLTVSNWQANIMIEQIRAMQREHGWCAIMFP